MIETATFVCSICNEPSLNICVRCTKDACANHRCARCKECSDCCECDVPLTEPEPQLKLDPDPAPQLKPDPAPDPAPELEPAPDPAPEPELEPEPEPPPVGHA